jgi:hypothetical protein
MDIHGQEPLGGGATKISGEIVLELRLSTTDTDLLSTLGVIHSRVQGLIDEFKPTIRRTDAGPV